MDNAKQFAEEMERRFGSDEALGVWFELEDEPGSRLSAAEHAKLWAENPNEPPETSAYLPHGGSATVCTDYAIHIFKAMDGVQIFGFANEDNPTSRVARDMIHSCGHDFAVVHGRFIVDPWPRIVPAVFEKMVFDLEDPEDAALALDIYGPRECWTHMVAIEEDARQARADNH